MVVKGGRPPASTTGTRHAREKRRLHAEDCLFDLDLAGHGLKLPCWAHFHGGAARKDSQVIHQPQQLRMFTDTGPHTIPWRGGHHPRHGIIRCRILLEEIDLVPVSYTHLRAHETVLDLVCRLLLEKKTHTNTNIATYTHLH